MEIPNIQNSIPACYVPLRRLTTSELTRISLNPFYVTSKCGRCHRRVQYGPKCSKCRLSFHYGCAIIRKACCEVNIVPIDSTPKLCPRCKSIAEFGPQCNVCGSRFHSHCIGPLEQCCHLNILERKVLGVCGKCTDVVLFGPRCPLCGNVYHANCAGEELECCGFKFEDDDDISFKCKLCNRRMGLESPMCISCGCLRHGYCIKKNNSCCGKQMSLEIYLIPSFTYTIRHYSQFDRRRAMLKKKEVIVDHTHELRNRRDLDKDADDTITERNTLMMNYLDNITAITKGNTTETRTDDLDNITIVSVKSDMDEVFSIKSELDEKIIDIEESPLEQEVELSSPEPSTSSMTTEGDDDSLKSLFDFLYNMVKKFPPQLQTEVKIDLFKTVTEADLKFKCQK